MKGPRKQGEASISQGGDHREQPGEILPPPRWCEECLPLAFHSSPVAIGISSLADGRFIDVNKTFLEIYGYDREEIIGRSSEELGLWADPETRREVLAALRDRGRVRNVEIRCRRKSGEIGSLLASAERIELAGEQCFLGTFIDITDRKKIEQELRDSEERYRMLFDVETDAILLADMETMSFIDANLAARFMYGYTPEEFLRMKPEDISAEPEKSRQDIESKRMLISHRLHRKKDGTIFPVEISGNYFEYRGRKVHVAAVRDITERKRSEKELNDRQNTINNMVMELSVVEEKERLRIAEHLHDQIAPKFLLTKMRIQSLAERLPAGEHDTTIEAIEALIDLAIEDIRSLTIQLRPPILAELGLEAALKWLAEEFNENYRLKVKISGDRETKPLSYELGSAIFQIVRELLLNISKHAGTKNASISMVKDEDKIKITVEDKGIGFDVANSSLNRPRTGGFGIFNARMKIEYLGGELEIESSPGSGTRVLIKAPLEIRRK